MAPACGVPKGLDGQQMLPMRSTLSNNLHRHVKKTKTYNKYFKILSSSMHFISGVFNFNSNQCLVSIDFSSVYFDDLLTQGE